MSKISNTLKDLISSVGLKEPAAALPEDKMHVCHMFNKTKFDYWKAGSKVGKSLAKLAGL